MSVANLKDHRAPGGTPRKPLHIEMDGEWQGYWFDIGRMTGRDLITLKRGELDEATALETIAGRISGHNFPVEDVLDLDADQLARMIEQWTEAQQAEALPQTNGEP